MCGQDDKLTKWLEDLESQGAGRMKGEASPYSWLFRYDLDQLWKTCLQMFAGRRSDEEQEELDEIYNVLATTRAVIRNTDRSTLTMMLEDPEGATSSVSLDGE